MNLEKKLLNKQIIVKDDGNKVFYQIITDDNLEDNVLYESKDIINEECIKGFLGKGIVEMKLLNSISSCNLPTEILQAKRNDGMTLKIISKDLQRNFTQLINMINDNRRNNYVNYCVNVFNCYANLKKITFDLKENNCSISMEQKGPNKELICHIPYVRKGTRILLDESDSKMVEDIISEYLSYINIGDNMDSLSVYAEGGLSICTCMTINTDKAKIVIDGMSLVDSLALYLEMIRREIEKKICNNNGKRENGWLVRILKD